MKRISGSRIAQYLVIPSIFLITAALIAGMAGCVYNPAPSQNLEIRDWYDLDTIRNNLAGNHTLMNDLDSTTPGYEELASPTANGGKGWQPIGTTANQFTGSFDGQGYEIRDLFVNRPDEDGVGLFMSLNVLHGEEVIKNVGVVNATVTGHMFVGVLVGVNRVNVSNSYCTGNVTGDSYVGGLMAANWATVSKSYFTGSVTGNWSSGVVGCLVAQNDGTVSNSYSTGNVTNNGFMGTAGGLTGGNVGTVSNSFSTGSVTGWLVGGLVGDNRLTVSNSYSTGNVTGSYAGGLVGINYDTVSNSYSIGNVKGDYEAGGLVGENWVFGNVSNSYSTGNVIGNSSVGGLVGVNDCCDGDTPGTVSNSFWDTETSGQATSAGGTGKNTTEMHDIVTFSGAGWNITAVANPGARNPAYIWNIVDNVTYPFLSWQP
jgi:hypothetical protein